MHGWKMGQAFWAVNETWRAAPRFACVASDMTADLPAGTTEVVTLHLGGIAEPPCTVHSCLEESLKKPEYEKWR